jgi:two-component system OmpR family response regulator
MEMETAKIAVVDDDPTFGAQLARLLTREGFTAIAYDHGEAFLAALPNSAPDLVLLDQIMPGATGMEVLRQVRASSALPCIMLTGSEDEATRIAGLEGGADDYIAKSAPPREILARIRIALRRAAGQPAHASATPQSAAPSARARWRFSPSERLLCDPSGQPVRLTSSEFELLHLLHERQGQPVSREECHRLVLRRPYRVEDRAIDTLVAKLRSKIEPERAGQRRIHALRGVGYVFVGFDVAPPGPAARALRARRDDQEA